MKTVKTRRAKHGPAWTLVAGAIVATAVGCVTTAPGAAGRAQGAASSALSGSEVWAQACIRCHNVRPPAELDDLQWAVAMRHMRIRANLTGEEEQVVLDFLRSGN